MTWLFPSEMPSRDQRRLDMFLACQYSQVRTASDTQQQTGIHKIITTRMGADLSAFVVTDTQPGRSAWAYIDTNEDDSAGNSLLAWAYTCPADLLIYYRPQHCDVYLLWFWVLREHLSRLRREYSSLAYRKKEVLVRRIRVPIYEFERLGIKGVL
ncbi:MAG: hypothetical protein DDT26_00121 [Dehalococcoidia bacterium]|nr:hypothetical protein [Chloroflexota bacterium]